jgi:energy-coupling factor transporter ATP-binding protein EcfA2
MLKAAHFRGFKALANVDVDLEPLTVFVGPNGAGKSSVLEALERVLTLTGPPSARGQSATSIFQGSSSLQTLLTKPDANELRVDVELTATPPAPYRHGFIGRLTEAGPSFVMVTDSLTAAVARGFPARPGVPARQVGDKPDAVEVDEPLWQNLVAPKLRALSSAVRYRFHPDVIAGAVPIGAPPGVAHDGRGLATALAHIILLRGSRIEKIESSLRQVVPLARGIRARRENQGSTTLDTFEIEIHGVGWLPSTSLSEGTLCTIAFLAALHVEEPRQISLVDDLDRGLHPTAQLALLRVIRTVQASNPELQFICTSHSPYLLDELKPEEVRVLKSGPDGLAVCRKLTDHPNWEKWKGRMRPGEFWGSVGEDWVTAPATQPAP